MQRFVLNENEKVVSLISGLNVVMQKYNQKDLDTPNTLLQFLNNAVEVFKNLGQPDNQTWIEGLKTKFITAENGVNPDTMEIQKLGRRTMQRNVFYQIMQEIEMTLRSMYNKNNEKIAQAEDLIRQIIMAGFHSKLLDPHLIKNADDPQKAQAIWRKLSSDSDISLAQKNVLMMINKYDVFILLGDLLIATS